MNNSSREIPPSPNPNNGSNRQQTPQSNHARTVDQISRTADRSRQIPQSQRRAVRSPDMKRSAKQTPQNPADGLGSLMAIYRENLCDCKDEQCKFQLQNRFRTLMKSDLNENEETVSNIINILTGQTASDKIVNILSNWVQKVHVETFNNHKMAEILDLFVVIYFKCPQALQLTFIDDIDKIIRLILEAKREIFDEGKFKYKIVFHGLFQYKHCVSKKTSSSDECEILKLALIKKRCKRYFQQTSSKSKVQLNCQSCNDHGGITPESAVMSLVEPKKFIQFICFLIQFKFKILNIEDVPSNERHSQRKELTNILFMMLENCNPAHYYFPIKALHEFYSTEVSEKALGKRLNSSTLLSYKLKKERLGRSKFLTDFSKPAGLQEELTSIGTAREHQNDLEDFDYPYIVQNTISIIGQVIPKSNVNMQVDCYILCLKILHKILANGYAEKKDSEVIDLVKQCLRAMSQNIESLSKPDKETYYSDVKELVRIIRKNHDILLSEPPSMEVDSFDSQVAYKNPTGGFYFPEEKKQTLHPDLTALEQLLTMNTIQKYPKLSLIAFDAIHPYISIFDNSLISFVDICKENRLLDVDKIQKEQTKVNSFKEKQQFKEVEDQLARLESDRMAIRRFSQYAPGRERALDYFIHRYQKKLNDALSQASKKVDEADQSKLQAMVQKVLRLKEALSKKEIIFIFDFLVEMLKHAETLELHAIGLSTHLLNNFDEKSGGQFSKSILASDEVVDPEVFALNFEMRAKKFIHDALPSSSDDMVPKDDIFSALFSTVSTKIAAPPKKGLSSQMEEYTSNFLKTVIRIFQSSRRFLNLDFVKKIIDQLLSEDKLLVVVNSMPLYLVIQMFFEPDQINSQETGLENIFTVILRELDRCRIDNIMARIGSEDPAMRFYRVRNLICVSTTMMQYFLCLQTPLCDKSSSSHLYSHNSQSQNQSPLQTHSQSQEDGVPAKSETYENTFFVKKQKNCNFCGELLPYPKEFSFSSKCPKCSMKNSILLLPARFLCNMCIDHSQNDLFLCPNSQIPLGSIRNAKNLQAPAQIKSIQKVMIQVLRLLLEDFKANASFYFDEKEACIDKACKPKHMFSNLVVILTNRILKLMENLFRHQIEVERDLIREFDRLEEVSAKLTKGFGAIKYRISEIMKKRLFVDARSQVLKDLDKTEI